VRKTHMGDKAITRPGQMDLKADYRERASKAGLRSHPKHFASFSGEGGRKMHLQEYVQGRAPRTKAERELVQVAGDEQRALAKRHGYELTDTTSKGNIVIRTGANGKPEAVVLDPIVSKSGSKSGLRSKDPHAKARKKLGEGEVMRETFDPSLAELQAYDKTLDAARRKAVGRR